jgi:hypothetical protein
LHGLAGSTVLLLEAGDNLGNSHPFRPEGGGP